jgi:hypothetical protein
VVLFLDKLVEPEHCLQERLLLRKSPALVRHIALDTEAMLYVRVKTHLIRDAHLLEDVFCLAPLLSREDLISF